MLWDSPLAPQARQEEALTIIPWPPFGRTDTLRTGRFGLRFSSGGCHDPDGPRGAGGGGRLGRGRRGGGTGRAVRDRRPEGRRRRPVGEGRPVPRNEARREDVPLRPIPRGRPQGRRGVPPALRLLRLPA